jgi:DNA-binding transcriptional ArsR family regulator
MAQHSVREISDFDHLSVSAALDALGDGRRRAVLRALDGAEGPVSVRELAAEIAAMPGTTTRGHDRVAVDLHHRTLPKLDALGIVDYDPEATAVEPRPALDDLLGLAEYIEYTSRSR